MLTFNESWHFVELWTTYVWQNSFLVFSYACVRWILYFAPLRHWCYCRIRLKLQSWYVSLCFVCVCLLWHYFRSSDDASGRCYLCVAIRNFRWNLGLKRLKMTNCLTFVDGLVFVLSCYSNSSLMCFLIDSVECLCTDSRLFISSALESGIPLLIFYLYLWMFQP